MNNELKYLIYNTPEEGVSVNAIIKDETIWLTQKAMAELFDVGIPGISKHLKNIFQEGELMEEVVISILETTTEHGAISKKQAEAKAKAEYEEFNKTQKIISDFEKGLKSLSKGGSDE